MRIEIDLSTIPPAIALRNAEDFTDFRVTVPAVRTAFVDRAELATLAGDHTADPDWNRRLEEMLAYAATRGWLRDDGAVRAHIEWRR